MNIMQMYGGRIIREAACHHPSDADSIGKSRVWRRPCAFGVVCPFLQVQAIKCIFNMCMAAYLMFKSSYFKETSYQEVVQGDQPAGDSRAQVASERKMLWNFCKTSRERCHRETNGKQRFTLESQHVEPKNKMDVLKMILIDNLVIFSFHVNLPGCKGFNDMDFNDMIFEWVKCNGGFGNVPLEWNYRKVSSNMFRVKEYWRSRVVCKYT